MATRFASTRVQNALGTPTGYRRRMRFTFSRGGVSTVLEPVSGSLTQDSRRGPRWDGKLTFSGQDLIPDSPADLLTPFGTRVTAELGLELLDGTVEYVPYGKYVISGSGAQVDPDRREVTVSLLDLSDIVDGYRFETPYTVAAGTTLSLMINNVVYSRTGFNPVVNTIPIVLTAARTFGLEAGTGPWAEILDVLKSFSLIAWYRRDGLIAAANPNPYAVTPYALTSLASLSADFDARPANVVVARGESTDSSVTPVQAVAMDTDPGSPTYAGTGPGTSPYGRRTEYFSSPLITTVSQAESAAQTVLDKNLGAGATYTLTSPYDPTTDALDVISFQGDNYVVDAITVDLNGETTRQVRKLA